jgi:hypothetical protein
LFACCQFAGDEGAGDAASAHAAQQVELGEKAERLELAHDPQV